MSDRIEMRFEVYPVHGESWQVTAQTRDIYVWEKTTKGASLHQLSGDGASMLAWYKVAHLAAVREGLYNDGLSAFTEAHDITLLEDEDEDADDGVDPTQPAPSGSSS